MNNLQKGSDDFNKELDSNNPGNNKKPNSLLDFLMGIGISAGAYALILFVTYGKLLITVKAFFCFIILAAFVFFIVKFFRTSHTAAAITMLILISPCILVLLLLGTCFLKFTPI